MERDTNSIWNDAFKKLCEVRKASKAQGEGEEFKAATLKWNELVDDLVKRRSESRDTQDQSGNDKNKVTLRHKALSVEDYQKRNCYFFLAKSGNFDILHAFIKDNISNKVCGEVDYKDVYGKTILHCLCAKEIHEQQQNLDGWLKLVDDLVNWLNLDNKGKVTKEMLLLKQDYKGQNCYYYLAKSGNFHILSHFIKENYKSLTNLFEHFQCNFVQVIAKWQSLRKFKEVMNENRETFDNLLKQASSLTEKGSKTLLHFACEHASNQKCPLNECPCELSKYCDTYGGEYCSLQTPREHTMAECNIHFLLTESDIDWKISDDDVLQTYMEKANNFNYLKKLSRVLLHLSHECCHPIKLEPTCVAKQPETTILNTSVPPEPHYRYASATATGGQSMKSKYIAIYFLDSPEKSLVLPTENKAERKLTQILLNDGFKKETTLKHILENEPTMVTEKFACCAVYEAFRTDNDNLMKCVIALPKLWKVVRQDSFVEVFVRWIAKKNNKGYGETKASGRNQKKCYVGIKPPALDSSNKEDKKLFLPSLDNEFDPMLVKMQQNFKRLEHLSLLGIAMKSGRLELTKLLLRVDQINVIPNCVRIMLECQVMKLKKMRTVKLDFLQDFCQTVLENALDALYEGATAKKRDLISEYLMGNLSEGCVYESEKESKESKESCCCGTFCTCGCCKNHCFCQCQKCCHPPKVCCCPTKFCSNTMKNLHNNKVDTECTQSGSKRHVGPRYRTFDIVKDDGPEENGNKDTNKRKHRKEKTFTIMEMIENLTVLAEVNKEDNDKLKNIFSIRCIRFVIKYEFRRLVDSVRCCVPLYKWNSHWFGFKFPYYRWSVLFDFLFLSIFTIYLITGILDDLPYKAKYREQIDFSQKVPQINLTTWYIHLYQLQSSTTGLFEGLLTFYWLGVLFEELSEFKSTQKKVKELMLSKAKINFLYTNFWNVVDWLYIILFGAGMSMKFYLYTSDELRYSTNVGNLYGNEKEFPNLFTVRVVLGISYLCISYRRLYHLAMWFRGIGVFYITLQRLLTRDLIPFFAMLLITVLCTGVLFHCLLFPGGVRYMQNGTSLDHNLISLIDVIIRPTYVAFGEYDLEKLNQCYSIYALDDKNKRGQARIFEEVESCSHPMGTFIYTKVVILIFMLLVNLTMFNLLIARFSLTVNRYNEVATSVYYWNLYQIYLNIQDAGSSPLPFNLFSNFFYFLHGIWRGLAYCCCCCVKNEQSEPAENWRVWTVDELSKRHHKSKWIKFLFYQAKSFATERCRFDHPVFDKAREADAAATKLQDIDEVHHGRVVRPLKKIQKILEKRENLKNDSA